MSKTVTAHCLVKNEERFIWYSINSIINHVDKVMLWDTGSRDLTWEIAKEIKRMYSSKVDLREGGEVDPESFTLVRQRMLEETKSDWFLVVDGDEVWWKESIERLIETINKQGDTLESIIVPFYTLVGDIYHYQVEAAGRYLIDGRRGHLTIRAINRKIPGLCVKNPYGQEGYFDESSKPIQERSPKKRKFLDTPFMHLTHLARSPANLDRNVPLRAAKFKYEVGRVFSYDFYYPEVFFKPRPKFVPSVWEKMESSFVAKSAILAFPRKVKRAWMK